MGCDIHLTVERKGEGGWEHVPGDYFTDRNYGLFALLADVRNNDGVTPIAEPRGVPRDASAESKEFLDDYGEGGHSHSWLSLADLFAYDWTTKVSHSGLIQDAYRDGSTGRAQDIADYANRTGEFPWSWRGEGVSYCQMTNASGYKAVSWTEAAWATAGPAFGWLIVRLARLGSPENVRILFFFDS